MRLLKASLIGLMMLFFVPSKAQKVFGLNSVQMKDTLSRYKYEYTQSKVGEDGVPYDIFMGDNRIMVNCYYDKEGRCFQYMQIYEKKRLIEKIQDLNAQYNKIDDRKWVSKNNNVSALIYVSNEDWFWVMYEYIGVKK